MRCIECGKYPFCRFIENPQGEDCKRNIKRPIGKGEILNEQRRSIKNSKR